MSEIYEDELMELQSDMISLCMEITDGKAEYIFVYCSNEKNSKFFNAFFSVGGRLTQLHELGVPDNVQWSFLDIGTEDLCKLDALGEKYNTRVPTEMKMAYQVKTNKFHARYQYDPVCVSRQVNGKIVGVHATDVYRSWMEQIKQGFKLS